MKNFVTAIASALLVAVILTELITRVWPDSRLALFLLAFLGIAGVTLFNVHQAARRMLGASEGAAPAAAPRRERGGRGNKAREPSGERKRSADTARPAAAIPDGPRESGTVKWFNRSKGFGFIVRENGEEIFVHHRSIRNSDDARRANLRDGQKVSYVVADHSKGQQAEDVTGE